MAQGIALKVLALALEALASSSEVLPSSSLALEVLASSSLEVFRTTEEVLVSICEESTPLLVLLFTIIIMISLFNVDSILIAFNYLQCVRY